MLTRQLNRLLVRDVEYMQKLQPLVGASLLFEITDLRFRATLIFHHTYVELLPDDAQPTLHLWGRSADFGKFLLLKASRQSLLQKREIDFAGDLFLLEKLEALLPTFKHLNLSLLKKIVRNRVDYYQEERSCIASPNQVAHFGSSLLQLQERLDRCEARLVYLIDRASSQ